MAFLLSQFQNLTDWRKELEKRITILIKLVSQSCSMFNSTSNKEISTKKKSNYLKEWKIVMWNCNEKKRIKIAWQDLKKKIKIDNFINHITAKARYFTHVISFLRLTSLSLLFKWQFDISKVQIAEKQLMKTAL